ncbi:hypothetical protein M3612_16690 [Niallia taxi]|uniref:hypothetical protein n=1 Tax=Niallia taxi TaxID=2499688 RepID=UPI002041788B|nr:hypothetical protein [Niallia taxi]MCM3216138.1 hypothetical protein [Niallia taxi]
MIGKVTVWHMTEEERLAYIAKHPIISYEKRSGQTFGMKNLEKLKASSKNGALSTKEMWQKRKSE